MITAIKKQLSKISVKRGVDLPTKKLTLRNIDELLKVCGNNDVNIKNLENKFNVQIFVKANMINVRGSNKKVDKAYDDLSELVYKVRNDKPINKVETQIPNQQTIRRSSDNVEVRPRSEHQREYMETILNNDIVLGVGPAGTGKTFLAVACAIQELKMGKIKKIVLTRPIVEAGEKLGFLPGTFQEKIDPYLRPLYDAFEAIVHNEKLKTFIDDKIIEIVPLAYMRGRTLENSCIILDEAQNTTKEQMKMFLTRLGQRSKMIITGDITQVDLVDKRKSGFIHSIKLLSKLDKIKIVNFDNSDVTRHPFVKDILMVYEEDEANSSDKS